MRETERETEKETERERARQRQRDRDTERQRERKRDRDSRAGSVPLTIRVATVFFPLVMQLYSPASSRRNFVICNVCTRPFFLTVNLSPSSTGLLPLFQVTGTLALEISQDSKTDFPSVTSWLSSSFSKNTDAAAETEPGHTLLTHASKES